jgi:uncharacterized protein (DUF1684 family)
VTSINNNSLKYSFSISLLVIVSSFSFALHAAMAGKENSAAEEVETHQQHIEAWRASRHERLSQPDGWLTLVGLEWIDDGESRIGSAADNDVQLNGGPAYWGSVFLVDKKLTFQNADNQNVKINDQFLDHADLVADTEGEPTLVSSGALTFHAIFRESYALRIKDSQAKTLADFKGVDNYPISESWRINGRFVLAEEGETLEIANVLGQISQSSVLGSFEFDMDGKTHSLLGIGSEESEQLWFIFADRTSGHATYGAGRFLYSDGMPENGRLTVDFNKAYNPPCAFNPYSTCPLPPQRNRMDLMVEAGEKDFHAESD